MNNSSFLHENVCLNFFIFVETQRWIKGGIGADITVEDKNSLGANKIAGIFFH